MFKHKYVNFIIRICHILIKIHILVNSCLKHRFHCQQEIELGILELQRKLQGKANNRLVLLVNYAKHLKKN
jgi:hypothetical protein